LVLLRFFYEIHKSISKTEKWELPDEIYKKLDECRNCGSRHERYNFLEANILYICHCVNHNSERKRSDTKYCGLHFFKFLEF
jgi:hypothetical protein